MFDPFKRPNVHWRRLHDYQNSSNERAQCMKCSRVLNAKSSGNWLGGDDSPVCNVTDASTLLELLENKKWWGLIPEARFEVEWAPFHIVQVSMHKAITEEKDGLTKTMIDYDLVHRK